MSCAARAKYSRQPRQKNPLPLPPKNLAALQCLLPQHDPTARSATVADRSKRPSFQWYPGDAQRDTALRSCPLEARGLWREMLDLMHDGEPYGHLTAGGVPITDATLASIAGISVRRCVALLFELEQRRVFSRTEAGVLYSRRMVRDGIEYEVWREKSQRGGLSSATKRATNGQPPAQPKGQPTPEPKGNTAVCSLQSAKQQRLLESEAGEAFDTLRTKLEAVGDLKHMPPETITALPARTRHALAKIGGHSIIKRTAQDKLVWLRRDFVKFYSEPTAQRGELQ